MSPKGTKSFGFRKAMNYTKKQTKKPALYTRVQAMVNEGKNSTFVKLTGKVIMFFVNVILGIYAGFYRLSRWQGSDLNIPWARVLVIGAFLLLLFKKEPGFNFGINNPLALNNPSMQLDQPENNAPKKILANHVTPANPQAPVDAEVLLPPQVEKYLDRFGNVAIAEMNKFGIPASVKLAQGLIESNSGKSNLARKNNNHFGIKCFSQNCKKGHCSNHSDDHHKDFFRTYKTAWESWRDHSKILNGKRYASLTKYEKNYKKWAEGLKKAGYATDENYDKKLIQTIEKYGLYKYDEM